MEENRELENITWKDSLIELNRTDVGQVFGEDFEAICENNDLYCYTSPYCINNPTTVIYIEVKDRLLVFMKSRFLHSPSLYSCNFAYTKDLDETLSNINLLQKMSPNKATQKCYSRESQYLGEHTRAFARISKDLLQSINPENIMITITATGKRLESYKKILGEDNPTFVYRKLNY